MQACFPLLFPPFLFVFLLPASSPVPGLVVYGAGVQTVYQRPHVLLLPLPLALVPPLFDLGAGPPRPGNGLPSGGHSVGSKVTGRHFPIYKQAVVHYLFACIAFITPGRLLKMARHTALFPLFCFNNSFFTFMFSYHQISPHHSTRLLPLSKFLLSVILFCFASGQRLQIKLKPYSGAVDKTTRPQEKQNVQNVV